MLVLVIPDKSLFKNHFEFCFLTAGAVKNGTPEFSRYIAPLSGSLNRLLLLCIVLCGKCSYFPRSVEVLFLLYFAALTRGRKRSYSVGVYIVHCRVNALKRLFLQCVVLYGGHRWYSSVVWDEAGILNWRRLSGAGRTNKNTQQPFKLRRHFTTTWSAQKTQSSCKNREMWSNWSNYLLLYLS